jgi:phage tail sheath gpL-like
VSTPIERMDLIELSKAVEEVELVDDLESDVSFVRILWVNISGQHRCRVSFLYFVSFI